MSYTLRIQCVDQLVTVIAVCVRVQVLNEAVCAMPNLCNRFPINHTAAIVHMH